jgi:hypothetical protein
VLVALCDDLNSGTAVANDSQPFATDIILFIIGGRMEEVPFEGV